MGNERPSLPAMNKNCLQDMGLNDGSLTEDQVHITSVFKQQHYKYGRTAILLTSNSGWKPATNSIQEYITIDFGETRDLSGIKTKGIHGEYSWVEKFWVSYSNDGYTWNIMKDRNTFEDRVFLGNYDSDSTVTEYFDQLINARYLR